MKVVDTTTGSVRCSGTDVLAEAPAVAVALVHARHLLRQRHRQRPHGGAHPHALQEQQRHFPGHRCLVRCEQWATVMNG